MLTIENSWDNIIPICGNHKERVEMVINNGPHSVFYSCPKYYPENRTSEERACNNRINLIEYRKMIDKLMGMIAEAELTALPDTRSWQVPKAYRVSTSEPAVRQPADRNVYNPCHTGFPAHTPAGVLKGCGSSRTRFAWLISYRSIFTVTGALRGSFSFKSQR